MGNLGRAFLSIVICVLTYTVIALNDWRKEKDALQETPKITLPCDNPKEIIDAAYRF